MAVARAQVGTGTVCYACAVSPHIDAIEPREDRVTSTPRSPSPAGSQRRGLTTLGSAARAFACAFTALALLAVAACSPVAPKLTGMTLAEADRALSSAGLVLGRTDYDAESRAATWTVVAQSAIARTSKGSTVDVILAGARPTGVPNVTGLSQLEASATIAAAGLRLLVADRTHDATMAASAVLSQDPAPDRLAPYGSEVRVVVSLGPDVPPSESLTMTLVKKLSGPYSPKSVVATQRGQVFAQNMIYRHTVTVFDDHTYKVIKTISDKVRLSDFGFPQYAQPVQGGPVEAAVTPDGRYVYVSNYSMYGPGFPRPGGDEGSPSSGVDPSFVYRIPLATLEIDQAIQVGSVPKYVAVTPDGRYLLVSNWISYSVTVIDVATSHRVTEVKVGRFPRGIAFDPASKTAYIAVMGSNDVAVIDMATFGLKWIRGVGASPRHLVMSPDGAYLYATLNGAGTVVKIDLATRKVVGRVKTGGNPRSMAMAPDGGSLYLVNYDSGTVSKVRTSDMKVIQDIVVGAKPIGITYVDATREIWVACYTGTITIFRDE
jgi:YVTN family beta-propeller protein